MATGTTNPEIISPGNKSQARRIVQELHCEILLSLDCEGIQLGKDGPLTLLQIGTLDGRVFIFDVMLNEREQEKSFFKDTGLESILTSTKIVKVIHSCSGDSAALFHQFGVHLQNVFDTQVAHLVIEEHKGRQLPTRLKHAEMCVQYSENAELYEGKADMKMKWCKQVGNFWAIRPLTDEMIDCASCDVTALIPEVYEIQKKYIDENGLYGKYLDRVQEEINYHIDPEQKERRKTRNKAIHIAILKNIDERDPTSEDFHSLSADEKKAVDNTRTPDLNKFSDKIKRLKQESAIWYMDDIEQRLQTPESFIPDSGVWYKLGEIERSRGKASQKKARSLKQRLSEVVLVDIETKYTPHTTLECLNPLECQVLNTIRTTGDNKQTFSETILSLHWKLVEEEIDEETEKTTKAPEYEVGITLGKLKFLSRSNEVPTHIKDKAIELKDIAVARVLRSIPQKYTEATGIEDLSGNARAVLETLQVGENHHSVVWDLYWKLTYENLCKSHSDLLSGKLRISDGFKRKLNFLKRNSSVPKKVQDKARGILFSASSGRR